MTRKAVALCSLLALFLLAPAAAVSAEEPVDWEMITRIRDEGLRHGQVMETLAHLTEEIGPRLTGSPQMKQANEWTRDRLTEWGLANAHLEPFEFGRGWSFTRTSVHLTAPYEMPLAALPKAWTPGTDGPVEGPVMRVEIEKKEDIEGYRGKVAGKILLLDDPRELEDSDGPVTRRLSDDELAERMEFDMPRDRRGGDDFRRRFRRRFEMREAFHDLLTEEGVLAIVEISSRDGTLVRVMGGGSREPDENPGVTALVMAAEHYNRLIRLLDRHGKKDEEEGEGEGEGENGEPAEPAAETAPSEAGAGEAVGEEEVGAEGGSDEEGVEIRLEIDVRARFHDDDLMAYNTVAEIPGTDLAREVVMAGAHLDSWHSGSGATDNGAGCAVVMEAVRILKTLGVEPRRTIRVALWGGEEQGLMGSRAYVREHLASRPEPEDPEQRKLPSFLREETGPLTLQPDHPHFAGYFNLDNGGGRIRGVYAQENAGVVPIFEAWLRPFHDLGATSVTQNNTRGTDHLSFNAVGLPGFQFIQDPMDYTSRTHHTSADTLDHVKADDLKQASVIMASFLYHAAMRDTQLPRPPMPRDEEDEGGTPRRGGGRRR